jgi:hypothetical protein
MTRLTLWAFRIVVRLLLWVGAVQQYYGKIIVKQVSDEDGEASDDFVMVLILDEYDRPKVSVILSMEQVEYINECRWKIEAGTFTDDDEDDE